MIRFIALEVELHGLNSPTVEPIVERVRKALTAEFEPDFASDIEIVVAQYAGRPE